MTAMNRRRFVGKALPGIAGAGMGIAGGTAEAQPSGERPRSTAAGVTVLNPRNRVPVSLIIDDSTCLVNMAHYGIPQFAEVFPDNYKQPWRTLPREIPDSFVRKFGEWCGENGVKGKYSIVPYPACVGWLDRYLPGWTRRELKDSLDLVKSLMLPNWDIHPEMVSHTVVIDTKTGRPYEENSARYMENWEWTAGKSADQLAEYMAYALRILRNMDLPCEGITTPGGFASQVLTELSLGTLDAVRDVYGAEIPHYFRHLFTDKQSVMPRVEHVSGLGGNDPRCVVSIIGCTGDWFGGWDGLTEGNVDRLITEDLRGGRLPEVIATGEPAIMVCHWPGIYFNGEEKGFAIFKEAVRRLNTGFDNLIWMKLSEIARYWAARELTAIHREGNRITFDAPYASPAFTVAVTSTVAAPPRLMLKGGSAKFDDAGGPLRLRPGTWTRDGDRTLVCYDLPKGQSSLVFGN